MTPRKPSIDDLPERGFPLAASDATLLLGEPEHVVVERYPSDVTRSLPSFVGPFALFSAAHVEACLLPGLVLTLEVHAPPGLGEVSYAVRAMEAGVPGVGFAEVVGMFPTREDAESWIGANAGGADVLVVAVRSPSS